MVSHTNRDRDICPWERFGYGVAGEYQHGGGGGRAQVESDDLHTEPPTNLLKKGAMAAADVEHHADRDRIPTQKAQDRCRIAEPAMCMLQLPIGPCYRVVWKGRMILEKLRIDTASQVSQIRQQKP
jgi:hypothetical protein